MKQMRTENTVSLTPYFPFFGAQEDEKEYRTLFPDSFTMFSDLADLEGEEQDGGSGPPLEPPSEGNASVLSARAFVHDEILKDLVAAHAACFSAANGSNAPISDRKATFLQDYLFGVEVLRTGGLALPAEVDEATWTGHLFAVCLKHQAITRVPSQAEDVDIQGSSPEEAAMVQAPVSAVLGRLEELLEEWPENEMIMQLKAIALRVLRMPATSPLKALLTGLELLLARAQVQQ
jgi:hypothetical protein